MFCCPLALFPGRDMDRVNLKWMCKKLWVNYCMWKTDCKFQNWIKTENEIENEANADAAAARAAASDAVFYLPSMVLPGSSRSNNSRSNGAITVKFMFVFSFWYWKLQVFWMEYFLSTAECTGLCNTNLLKKRMKKLLESFRDLLRAFETFGDSGGLEISWEASSEVFSKN